MVKTPLDLLLGQYYRAVVLEKSPTAPIIQRIKDAMEDPQIAEEAKTRLDGLATVHDNRCFISKIHKQCLREVLNDKA